MLALAFVGALGASIVGARVIAARHRVAPLELVGARDSPLEKFLRLWSKQRSELFVLDPSVARRTIHLVHCVVPLTWDLTRALLVQNGFVVEERVVRGREVILVYAGRRWDGLRELTAPVFTAVVQRCEGAELAIVTGSRDEVEARVRKIRALNAGLE